MGVRAAPVGRGVVVPRLRVVPGWGAAEPEILSVVVRIGWV
jgi:hypothetical protein